jgi:nucleotide-binding universal stress UspA family protein
MAATDHFLHKVFEPAASANGAEVVSQVIIASSDASNDVGRAICQHVEKLKPAALVMMRQNKSTMTILFMGSVTQYCAVHSPAPVTILPQDQP